MNDTLTGIAIFLFLALIVFGGGYAVLKLKWRLDAAEKALRTERLKNSRLQRELGDAATETDDLPPLRRRAVPLSDGQPPALTPLKSKPIVGPMHTPPAGVHATLAYIRTALSEPYRSDPYLFSLGWEEADGVGSIIAASLHGDSPIKANHLLCTAENDAGKGVLSFYIYWMLCAKLTPEQMQVVWIDPKRDGALLKRSAHLWCEPCMSDAEIMAAMSLLQLERRRRTLLREQHEVLRWEELPDHVRPPMIWVYFGELDLVIQVIMRQLDLSASQAEEYLDSWLTGELVSARAEGMRYLIDVQDPANRKMRWRKQIACFAAGYTSTWKGIEPALNATMDEIRSAGAMLPNTFTAPGYFTVRVRSDFATVRTPAIDLPTRKAAIAELPHVEVATLVGARLAEVQALARAQGLLETEDEPTLTEEGAIDYAAPYTRPASRRIQDQPTADQIETWRTQVLAWDAQGLRPYKMVQQMKGIRNATAYRLIEIVLGNDALTEDAPAPLEAQR